MHEPFRDVVVIGRGILGSAAARHLAMLGCAVTVVGPDEPVNRSSHTGVFGSHYDSGRINRILDRDPFYAQIAAASTARYDDLERESGITFFTPTGHMTVTAIPKLLDELRAVASSFELRCTEHDADAMNRVFPSLRVDQNMTGLLESGTGGHIDPRRLIAAQCEATHQQGGVVANETVVGLSQEEQGARVVLESGEEIRCHDVLMATGAFANLAGLLPEEVCVDVERHTTVLAEVSADEAEKLASLPTVIYKWGTKPDESVYVLPPIRYPDGNQYVKIGQSTGEPMINPGNELVRWFQTAGNPETAQWLELQLRSLLPETTFHSTHSDSCVVTKSSSGRPFIDRFEGTNVYTLLAGNGQVAKSADELGRMAAVFITTGEIPTEYQGEDFAMITR